jgi:hypothetical protein
MPAYFLLKIFKRIVQIPLHFSLPNSLLNLSQFCYIYSLGSDIAVIGCTDSTVWWFLIPDSVILKSVISTDEKMAIDDNQNIPTFSPEIIAKNVFPNNSSEKFSYEDCPAITAKIFRCFSSHIDDIIFWNLYPYVPYLPCVTGSAGYLGNTGKMGGHGEESSVGYRESENRNTSDGNNSDQNGNQDENENQNENSDNNTKKILGPDSSHLFTHLCVVCREGVTIVGVRRVCEMVFGDESFLSAPLYHTHTLTHTDGHTPARTHRQTHGNSEFQSNVFPAEIDSNAGYNRPNLQDFTPSKKGNNSQYIGAYTNMEGEDKYGNLAFLSVTGGVLYASLLLPFGEKSFSRENPYKEFSRKKSDEIYGFEDHEKISLSLPHRITSDCCPYILNCTIRYTESDIEIVNESSATAVKALKKEVENVIETAKVENEARKNGLNLTVFDDCTGKNENIFLPHLFNCSAADDDVLCVLKKMCGTESTSISSEKKDAKDVDNSGKNLDIIINILKSFYTKYFEYL